MKIGPIIILILGVFLLILLIICIFNFIDFNKKIERHLWFINIEDEVYGVDEEE